MARGASSIVGSKQWKNPLLLNLEMLFTEKQIGSVLGYLWIHSPVLFYSL